MLSSGQEFDEKLLDSKHVLKVIFKPSRKYNDFSFLPDPILLCWLKILHSIHIVHTAINDILSWVCASKRTFTHRKLVSSAKIAKQFCNKKVQKTIRRCGGGPFQGRRKFLKPGGGCMCVQMDFTWTFQTTTKCNNINHA